MLEKFWGDWKSWNKYSKRIWIKTEFAICLAWAESDLGKQLKTNHNYFNVGNKDNGATITFKSDEDAFNALWEIALNWTYLRTKQTLSHLSPNHSDSSCQKNWTKECDKVYASSKENWLNNMRNCLSNIYQKQIDADFTFRIN
jgi:hypothetical protein